MARDQEGGIDVGKECRIGCAEGICLSQENFRSTTSENDVFWCIFRTDLGFREDCLNTEV